jgi:hypothetical protein
VKSNLADAVFGTGDFQHNELNIDLSQDPRIKHLVIKSESGLKISSVSGNSLTSIDIYGTDIEISDLCMFTSSTGLDNLKTVRIRGTLVNFNAEQFDCDVPRFASSTEPAKVILNITHISVMYFLLLCFSTSIITFTKIKNYN